MKTLFVLTFILVASLKGISQTEWLNRYKSPEFEINYSYTECHDQINDVHQRIIVFQFVNLTNHQLSVSYDKQMWYGDNCTGCDRSPEHQFTVNLEPRQIITGSCEDKKNKALYIVEKMLNVESTSLTKFELTNIKILK